MRYNERVGLLPPINRSKSGIRNYGDLDVRRVAFIKISLSTAHFSGSDTTAGTIKRIQKLSQMGFTHAIFNLPDVYKMGSLETFSEEIIPVVAEL